MRHNQCQLTLCKLKHNHYRYECLDKTSKQKAYTNRADKALHQMLRMSVYGSNTCNQPNLPLINHFINDHLLAQLQDSYSFSSK